MSNDAPKQESSFEKGFGFGFGIVWAILVIIVGVAVFVLVIERFGPPNTRAWSRPVATIGTPGGGYVPGAPRDAKECTDRGGSVVLGGKGCQGYR